MYKVLSNMMVDLRAYVDFDPEERGRHRVSISIRFSRSILEENDDASDEEIKRALSAEISHDLIPKHITKEDIICFHQLQHASGIRYRQSG